jgi:hypothetical protein
MAAFGMSGVGSTEDDCLAAMTRTNDGQRQREFVAGVVHLTGDAIGVSGVSGVSLRPLGGPGPAAVYGRKPALLSSAAGALQERDGIRWPR